MEFPVEKSQRDFWTHYEVGREEGREGGREGGRVVEDFWTHYELREGRREGGKNGC